MKKSRKDSTGGRRRKQEKAAAQRKVEASEARANRLAKQVLQEEPGIENTRRELIAEMRLEGRAIRQWGERLSEVKEKALIATENTLDNDGVSPAVKAIAVGNVIRMNAQEMEQEKRNKGIYGDQHLHAHLNQPAPTRDPVTESNNRDAAIEAINRLAEEFGSPEVIPSDKDTGEQGHEAGSPLVEPFDDHEESGPLAG